MGEAKEIALQVIREVRPVRGYAVVRPHPKAERTEGGILLPKAKTYDEIAARQHGVDDVEFTGTLVACGPGRVTSSGEEMAPEFGTGDEVFFIGNSAAIKFEAALADSPKHAETGEPRRETLYMIDHDYICASIRRE